MQTRSSWATKADIEALKAAIDELHADVAAMHRDLRAIRTLLYELQGRTWWWRLRWALTGRR